MLSEQKYFVILTYFYTNSNEAIVIFLTPFCTLRLWLSKRSIKQADNKSLLEATLKTKIWTIKTKQMIQKPPPKPSHIPQLFSADLCGS